MVKIVFVKNLLNVFFQASVIICQKRRYHITCISYVVRWNRCIGKPPEWTDRRVSVAGADRCSLGDWVNNVAVLFYMCMVLTMFINAVLMFI